MPADPLLPPARFLEEAEAHGIRFDPGDLERLGRYLALLLEANTRFNLTAVTDPGEAWMKHVFDSLTLLPWVQATEAQTVADVGPGGGLPGLPLAIVLPEVRFVLVEATGKKARFLKDAAGALDLRNVEVVNERAETVGRDAEQHRQRYDVVVARAVGPLAVLLELTVPLARVGGFVLAVKGRSAPQEIEDAKAALHLLHAAVADTARTPTGTVVAVRKQRPTPKRYPRRPGEPKRAPLAQETAPGRRPAGRGRA